MATQKLDDAPGPNISDLIADVSHPTLLVLQRQAPLRVPQMPKLRDRSPQSGRWTPFPFLKLAAELRNNVYEYAVFPTMESRQVRLRKCDEKNLQEGRVSIIDAVLGRYMQDNVFPAITRANSQLWRETLHLFGNGATFIYTDRTCDNNNNAVQEIHRYICDRLLPHMSFRLEMVFGVIGFLHGAPTYQGRPTAPQHSTALSNAQKRRGLALAAWGFETRTLEQDPEVTFAITLPPFARKYHSCLKLEQHFDSVHSDSVQLTPELTWLYSRDVEINKESIKDAVYSDFAAKYHLRPLSTLDDNIKWALKTLLRIRSIQERPKPVTMVQGLAEKKKDVVGNVKPREVPSASLVAETIKRISAKRKLIEME